MQTVRIAWAMILIWCAEVLHGMSYWSLVKCERLVYLSNKRLDKVFQNMARKQPKVSDITRIMRKEK